MTVFRTACSRARHPAGRRADTGEPHLCLTNKKVTRQTFHDGCASGGRSCDLERVISSVRLRSARSDMPPLRLLKSQDDRGCDQAFTASRRRPAFRLLREHILIVPNSWSAKNGDAEAFEDAHARWYVNADEIGAFLHAANPRHWPLDEMQEMMREHLDLTLNEASARLNEDWEADIAAYDEIHVQILHMADMLSDGIIRQFPQKFR